MRTRKNKRKQRRRTRRKRGGACEKENKNQGIEDYGIFDGCLKRDELRNDLHLHFEYKYPAGPEGKWYKLPEPTTGIAGYGITTVNLGNNADEKHGTIGKDMHTVFQDVMRNPTSKKKIIEEIQKKHPEHKLEKIIYKQGNDDIKDEEVNFRCACPEKKEEEKKEEEKYGVVRNIPLQSSTPPPPPQAKVESVKPQQPTKKLNYDNWFTEGNTFYCRKKEGKKFQPLRTGDKYGIIASSPSYTFCKLPPLYNKTTTIDTTTNKRKTKFCKTQTDRYGESKNGLSYVIDDSTTAAGKIEQENFEKKKKIYEEIQDKLEKIVGTDFLQNQGKLNFKNQEQWKNELKKHFDTQSKKKVENMIYTIINNKFYTKMTDCPATQRHTGGRKRKTKRRRRRGGVKTKKSPTKKSPKKSPKKSQRKRTPKRKRTYIVKQKPPKRTHNNVSLTVQELERIEESNVEKSAFRNLFQTSGIEITKPNKLLSKNKIAQKQLPPTHWKRDGHDKPIRLPTRKGGRKRRRRRTKKRRRRRR